MFTLSSISARLSHLNIELLFWLKLGFPVTKYYGNFPSNAGSLGAIENLTEPVERKNSAKRNNG